MPEVFSPQEKMTDTKPDVAASAKPYLAPYNDVGLFSSYCPHPKGITFSNQEHDEVIQLLLRRHIATNIPWLIKTALLILALPTIYVVLMFVPLFSFKIPAGITVSLIAFYYLIVFGYAFSNFISWFYNIGLITDRRVVDMDSYNILHHNVAATHLIDIVDVEFTQKGFLASTFNFGDIHIHTEAVKAGLQSNFEFTATPNPAKVTDIIVDLREKMKGGK